MNEIMSPVSTIVGFIVAGLGCWKLAIEVRKARREDRADMEARIRDDLMRDFKIDQAERTIAAKNRELELKERIIVDQASRLSQAVPAPQQPPTRQNIEGATT